VFVVTPKAGTVQALGTFYIRADGSVDPPTLLIQRNGDLYTLTGNINSSGSGIVIERNNTILDGAGFLLQGSGSYDPAGLTLAKVKNVSIKNTNIEDFTYGIKLDYHSDYNNLSGNNIRNSRIGIYLNFSNNNGVSGNNITGGYYDGIWLRSSSNNNVSGNSISANSNYGIELDYSSNNNNIVGNNVTDNTSGIVLSYSSNNNNIAGNNITNNDQEGIKYGWGSCNSIITGNNIESSWYGITLDLSSNNNISGNRIAHNEYGIVLGNERNDCVYHNNFIDNTHQASLQNCTAAWDDGFPSGGNYWSDYLTRYPNASEIDASGIWDIPYEIDANNIDHYPLIIPEFPSFLIVPLFMSTTLLAMVFYRRKHKAD
jgi:parallel beta-helix repeat protein